MQPVASVYAGVEDRIVIWSEVSSEPSASPPQLA
jgi:hypothetical protein